MHIDSIEASSDAAGRDNGKQLASAGKLEPQKPKSSSQPLSSSHSSGKRSKKPAGKQVPIRNRNRDRDSSDKPQNPGSETLAYHAQIKAEPTATDKGKMAEATEDSESDLCFICASPIIYTAVAPCNHATCHICALRLRALYKSRACAHCRTEAKTVIFTDDAMRSFESFLSTDMVETDDALGIQYTRKEIHADTLLLLRYNCPISTCETASWGWPDLHRHVRSVHHKVMCDLCTRNKKVFTHEHELFSAQELKRHEKTGDDHPGAVDQSGFRGHPECGFCRERFYGDDELFTHCREKHERCHICDRQREGKKQQYFADYGALEAHFQTEHFACLDTECLEKKFIVFESEMDLKAHQLETHPTGLSKDARRDARRVDISTFDYRTPHQDHSRSRGQQAGRGNQRTQARGRDPNIEPLSSSTAQPLRRDEVAYQRQLAIHSAQSVTARSFGGQLTKPEEHQAGPRQTQSKEAVSSSSSSSKILSGPTRDQHVQPRSGGSSSLSGQQNPQTLQQQARELQNAAVLDRAAVMLRQDETKLSVFRNNVSAYRAQRLTPTQMIDSFFSLFDASSSELGKLVKELADLYENDERRVSLLSAWQDWRAINEDYPSLPGPMGGSAKVHGNVSSTAGNRLTRLKHSTAQSSRAAAAVSQRKKWDNTPQISNHFPAISNTGSIARVGSTTPWIGVGSATSSFSTPKPSSSRADEMTLSRDAVGQQSRSGASAKTLDAFPALPAAPKPNIKMAGLTRGSVTWKDPKQKIKDSPWHATTEQGQPESAEGNANGAETSDVSSKKKGNKPKKQVLLQYG